MEYPTDNRNPEQAALLAGVRELLGPRITSAVIATDSLVEIEAGRDDVLWIARLLRDDPSLSFDFLSCVSAVDYEGYYEVVYHLHSLTKPASIRMKVRLEGGLPSVPSVTAIWPTANWHEREAYDLFGVTFEGHPNLERIMMEEDFEGHPMRKSYPQPQGRSRE